MSRATAKLLSVVALLALAGCGEDRGAGATVKTTPWPVAPAGSRAVAVSLTEYELTPPTPRVGQAGMITFAVANDGDVRHALAVEGPVGDVRTRALRPGERTTIKLPLPPGSYRWYCPLANHERLGMAGRVTRSRARQPSG